MKKTNDFFEELYNIINVYLYKMKHLSVEHQSCTTCNAVYSYILSFAVDDKDYKSLKNYNIGYSVHYWMKNKNNAKDVCESIVFDILCLVDGVAAENNFTTVDINVKLPENQEYHAAWCTYLNEKTNNS